MSPEQREYGCRLFAALSNPSRLAIVEYLADKSASVNEIAQAVGLRQPLASQHLSVLHAAGIVVYTPIGSQRLYRTRGPRIARILELVEEFYEIHLDPLRRLLAQHSAEVVGTGRAG